MSTWGCKAKALALTVAVLFTAVGVKPHMMTASTEDNSAGSVFSCGAPDRQYVALTFDDGPHPVYTPEILDILKNEGVNATFFVVGKNATWYPEIVERIINEGHEIGNHTYNHTFLGGLGYDGVRREVDLCDDEIYCHSEYYSGLMRPPGGIYDDVVSRFCAERGYTLIMWSIDTKDWTGACCEHIRAEIIHNITCGSVVLMHDYNGGVSHTPEALRIIIPELKKLGYTFVTVSELIDQNS